MTPRCRPLAAALGLVFLASPAGAKAPTLEDLVREFTLDNGLTLLVVENHDSPTIGAVTAFAVGGAEEKPGLHGVTHILEHLLFKGTPEIGTKDWEAERPHHLRIEELTQEMLREKAEFEPDQDRIAELAAEREAEMAAAKELAVDNELDARYSEAGGVFTNAFTSYDVTAYIQAIPSNRLELWLYLESERLREPVLRQFYTEVQNVQEERRMSVDSQPGGALEETFLSTAFDHHGYGFSLIGYPDDIDGITRTEAEDWFRVYYAPNRLTIALVGDVDADDMHRRVQEYFGDIPRQDPPAPLETRDLPLRGPRRVDVEFDAEPRLVMGWHKANLPSADDAALRVVSQILTGGRSSRLERGLVEERQVAASVSTDHEYPGIRWDNMFVVQASPRSPHTAVELEEAIWEELGRMKREPVSERELEKAKNRIRAARMRELASNFWTAVQLAMHQSSFGDWRVMLESDAAVEAVTAEDVRRVSSATFRRNRTVTATLVAPSFEPDPEKEAAGTVAVAAMVEALGGEAVTGIRSARVTTAVTLTTPMGAMEAIGRAVYAVPDRVRSELEIPSFGMTQVQAVDGPVVWSEARGQVSELEGDEARSLREDLERDFFLLAYPAVRHDYVLQGEAGDGTESVVEVRRPSGKPFTVFLDGETSLPVRVIYEGAHPMTGEPAAIEESFSDFREVDGVRRPHHIVTSVDGEKFAESVVTGVTINGNVAADEFALPAGPTG